MEIHGALSIKIEEADPSTGKPYLILTTGDGTALAITTNIGEMIGGAAKGARERFEDGQRRPRATSCTDPDVKTSSHLTTDPSDPRLGRGADDKAGPQNEVYLVLSAEERAKGFVRPVRESYVHTKCGVVTRMGLELAETYARNPKFYGSTYCVSCRMHLPVGEFLWDKTDEVVGS